MSLRKYKSLFSTTLQSSIGTGTGDTITLNSAAGLPTDTEITITVDRVDTNGTSTPSKMERITGTLSGSNLTSYTRGVDGTTEQAHSAGAVVEMVWNAADWNANVDAFLEEHDIDGTHSVSKMITEGTVLDEDDMASDSATALATQQSIKAYVDNNPYGGWLTTGISGVTVTRESTDNPTVVLRFDADVRDYIWKGMRIKATENSIVHYFIVSAEPTDDSGDTLVTCLSEIDTSTPTQAKNLIGATTISDVAYAPPKTFPKGFPIDGRSWEMRVADGANRQQSSPTQNTWYNLNSFSLSIPIGDWDLGYKVNLGAYANADVLVDAQSTLSTSSNTESDADYTCRLLGGKTAANSNGFSPVTFSKKVSLASKTTYYLNTRTTLSGMSQVNNRGDAGNTIIRATSTLL